MTGVKIDDAVFSNLLKFYEPKIFEKLQELNFGTYYFAIRWFIALYTNQNFSIEIL